jgi:DNA replication and repair protein RecF
MSLLRLDITDFRNLETIKTDLLPAGFNLFYGKNGSGKTSLLEAVYYLSRGRSFRSAHNGYVIRHSSQKMSVFAHVQTADSRFVPAGIERSRNGETRTRVMGQDGVSATELVRLVPVLLMNSNSFSLLEGPIFRRKYLDWGAFYVTPDFLRTWKQYERVLKQRNAALRERASKKEIETWTAELIKSAEQLDEMRRDFTQQLLPFLWDALAALITIPGLKLDFYPGWDQRLSFAEAITQSMDKDAYAGYTQIGPHRADFKITIGSTQAKDILSRGQQKLVVCAMICAQGAMLQQCIKRKPIYLVDDLPSELDSQSRSSLMTLLAKQEAQVFLTAIEHEDLCDSFASASMKMFHVEHGNVREVMPVSDLDLV